MLKTVLHNKTNETITLMESQGGVLRVMPEHTLQRGERKTVRTNESATYKEYWCAVQANNEKVVLTSDDCIEWKELVIKHAVDASGANLESIIWMGTVKRKSTNQAPVAAGTSGSAGSTSSQLPAGQPSKAGSVVPAKSDLVLSSLKQRIRNFFWGTSNPSGTSLPTCAASTLLV